MMYRHMPSLATKNDEAIQTGVFAFGLVAGGVSALAVDIPPTAVMVVFALMFVIYQYRWE